MSHFQEKSYECVWFKVISVTRDLRISADQLFEGPFTRGWEGVQFPEKVITAWYSGSAQ